ncbi:helix-turn-helix domain-containing protein [Streptosporangium sp. KLBMP 9127]|nr:helix-turn-helix domain-containing protein [Streptosporangium sp. KLBMP 9127]
MNTARDARDEAKNPALQGRSARSTVLRLLVGAQLRRLREACGISPDDAAYEIRASASKISRMELGRVGFKERDVADLLTLYGMTDPGDREPVLELARQSNTPGWWQSYGDVVPGWFENYLGLEQAASVIRGYEVQFVPGLLQTADYARAVIRLGHPTARESEIERRVSLRMNRAQILHKPDPTKLWVVVDEAVLRRPMGGTATMRAQIQHLIELNALPNVTIQVIMLSTGGHAAAGGPIAILRFPERDLPDAVYLEQLTSAVYPDKPADVQGYWDVMNRLTLAAEPAAATPGILRAALDQLP